MEKLNTYFEKALTFLNAHVFIDATLYQVLATVAAVVVAYVLAGRLRSRLEQSPYLREHYQVKQQVKTLLLPLLWCAVQWLAVVAFTQGEVESYIARVVAYLLTAWVVIRFTTNFVRLPVLSKSIAWVTWVFAALSILNLLEPTMELLDSVAMEVGQVRLSLLSVTKGLLTIALFLWVATTLSRQLERRINTYSEIEPSLRVLFGKLVKISLITIAVVVALTSVGIDMSAFAVFGGAVGVGIGFGLQKVVSNLICGVILLLDRSIKPGDIIAINNGEMFGWVDSLSARCVSIKTRDGQEHLIPNEDFITQKVENWSYSDKNIRVKIPVGVAYDSDVKKALTLLESACDDVERVLSSPAPAARLMGFGDSSVDLELRIWVKDPESGVANVTSEVLLRVWELFRENNIEIPYPQRDLHLKLEEVKGVISEMAKA